MINRVTTGVVYFFTALAELGLFTRAVMRFFSADNANGFVHWVYISTNTLMEPFRGTFTTTSVGHNHLVDFPALFVMAAYGVVALAFLALADWLSRVGLDRK